MASILNKRALVIYSISRLLNPEVEKKQYTRYDLANALDISISTLDLYLTQLKRDGLITRNKKRYPRSLSESISIIPKGQKTILEIKKQIENSVLTPENHNIPSMVPLKVILENIRDPLEEILFLSIYFSIPDFDLYGYLSTVKDLREDSNMVRVLKTIQEEHPQEALPVVGALFRACFYGDISPDSFNSKDAYGSNIFDLLLIAEATQKQGRLKEATIIYEHILSGKVKVTKNQWFIARAGLALTMFKEGNSEGAINAITSLIEETDNKILKAYGKQVHARMLSSLHRLDEALALHNSTIKAFDQHGIPLLSCIAHNNRGVAYFRMDNFDLAMEDWEKAVKFARKAKSDYSEVHILTNIADVQSQRGDPEHGLQLLERSRKFFKKINDPEGISGVEYNLSLVLLDKKDLTGALDHFNLSNSIAYPLPPPVEKKERLTTFMERAHQNGFVEVNEATVGP